MDIGHSLKEELFTHVSGLTGFFLYAWIPGDVVPTQHGGRMVGICGGSRLRI